MASIRSINLNLLGCIDWNWHRNARELKRSSARFQYHSLKKNILISARVDLIFQFKLRFFRSRKWNIQPDACFKKENKNHTLKYWFISIDASIIWSENDQLFYCPNRYKNAVYCEFDMHDFSFIDCDSAKSLFIWVSIFRKQHFIWFSNC